MFNFLKKLWNSAFGKIAVEAYKEKNGNELTDEIIGALDEELEDKVEK